MQVESFSKKRLIKLIGVALASVILPGLCLFLRGDNWLDIAVKAGIGVLFAVVLILYIEYERLDGHLINGRSDSLNQFILTILAEIVIISGLMFAPNFCGCYMLIPVIARASGKGKVTVIVAIYSMFMLALSAKSLYQLIAMVAVVIAGIILCDFNDKKNRIVVGTIAIAFSFAINSSLYFLQAYTIDTFWFSIILGVSIANGLFVSLLTPIADGIEKKREYTSIDTLMSDSYHLKNEFAQYYQTDYEHAINTSKLAKDAALAIGADDKLAEAGAFYYRIGITLGDDYVTNALKIAEENCFPEKLINILHEYNGTICKPSSVESAIVQICDCIMTKHDVLGGETFTSNWNRDVIVIQTMNEKSQEGLYDESGLSMNMYLKVRDSITSQEILR